MAATYTPISSIALSASASSVSFNSIPNTFTDLILVVTYQTSIDDDQLSLRFNSDTGSNYAWVQLTGTASSAGSARYNSENSLRIANYSTNTTYYPMNISHIMNYASANTFKTVISRWADVTINNGLQCGLWRSTNVVTSITLSASPSSGVSLLSGSTFDLYGILGANA